MSPCPARRFLVTALVFASVGVAIGAGGPGEALRFMGGGSVFVQHHDRLNAFPITVTAWFRTTQTSPAGLVTKSATAGLNGWRVFLENNDVRATYEGNGSYVGDSANPLRVPLGGGDVWHHVAFTVGADGGRLYVDGVQRDTRNWTGPPSTPTTTDEMRIGAFRGGANLFEGLVDEVTVWNAALTQSQVQFIMNRVLGGNEPNLVAYYRCGQETAGANVTDSAPLAGNNLGIIDGTATFVPSSIIPFTPYVETLPATQLVLNGVANPFGTNTSAWFEWGTTTNYGNVTPAQDMGDGTFNINFSQALSGLVHGVTYRFRGVASNRLGVAFGDDRNFTVGLFTQLDLPDATFAQDKTGPASWADYDGDGQLDLSCAGYSGLFDAVDGIIMRNTDIGFTSLVFRVAFALPRMAPATSWVDYDHDGLLDIAVGSQLLRNDAGIFTGTNTGLPTFARFGVVCSWGDLDNNGKDDPAIIGDTDSYYRLWVGRNVRGRFEDAGLERITAVFSPLAWGDYDNDGRLDLVHAGALFRNTVAGFSNINAGLPMVLEGSVAWGDYDADGRLDIVLTGKTNEFGTPQRVSQVWRNTGAGFLNINAGLPGVIFGSAAWGDYDNDGLLDILLTGSTNGNASGALCQIWRNTGSGFGAVATGFPGVYQGSAVWGDYDNDGRLDIGLSGTSTSNKPIVQVWHNNTPIANTPPSAPSGLSFAVIDNEITFSWNSSNDPQTSTSGLTYNLRVGTTPGGGEIVGAMAAKNGFRRVPAFGNAQTRLSRTIRADVPVGQPVYWSVQAVDNAFAGSAFASGLSFVLHHAAGPPNSTQPVPGDVNGDGHVSESELHIVLANYFTNNEWLRMTNVAGLGVSDVTFALTNSTSRAFGVEYSTNLLEWLFLGPATPRYEFIDTNAPGGPQRYYRLRLP